MSRSPRSQFLSADGPSTATQSATARNGQHRGHAKASGASQRREAVPLSLVVRLVALVVLVALMGAGVGYAVSILLPKQYAARAEIQYKLSRSVPNELLREDRTLTTQKVLLRSMAVVRPVAEANKIAPEHLADNISAAVVANSEVIDVEMRADTREQAQKLLAAVIDRYLVEANRDWDDPVRAYLETQITGLEDQLQEVRGQLQPGLSEERTSELTNRQHDLTILVKHFQQGLSDDSDLLTAPPARILISPYQIADPVRPRPLLNAAAGAAAAFVVAALTVLVFARRTS